MKPPEYIRIIEAVRAGKELTWMGDPWSIGNITIRDLLEDWDKIGIVESDTETEEPIMCECGFFHLKHEPHVCVLSEKKKLETELKDLRARYAKRNDVIKRGYATISKLQLAIMKLKDRYRELGEMAVDADEAWEEDEKRDFRNHQAGIWECLELLEEVWKGDELVTIDRIGNLRISGTTMWCAFVETEYTNEAGEVKKSFMVPVSGHWVIAATDNGPRLIEPCPIKDALTETYQNTVENFKRLKVRWWDYLNHPPRFPAEFLMSKIKDGEKYAALDHIEEGDYLLQHHANWKIARRKGK